MVRESSTRIKKPVVRSAQTALVKYTCFRVIRACSVASILRIALLLENILIEYRLADR